MYKSLFSILKQHVFENSNCDRELSIHVMWTYLYVRALLKMIYYYLGRSRQNWHLVDTY